ncbi:hypothetical protein MKW92_021714 [Papaver armeniacum]|nr:hypothetical protein MKW92_021714 [Papaver armeniacum]
MGKRNGAGSLLSPQNLQWGCVIASAVLIVANGTSIHKSFLVPLFILQAPEEIFSWIKGENGVWAVFLALAFKLFYIFPKELELPLYAMLFVIASPQQVVKLRGTQTGSLFLWMGIEILQKGFQQGSILATVCIICINLAPLMILIGSKL